MNKIFLVPCGRLTLRLAFFLFSFHHSVKFGPIQKLKAYLGKRNKGKSWHYKVVSVDIYWNINKIFLVPCGRLTLRLAFFLRCAWLFFPFSKVVSVDIYWNINKIFLVPCGRLTLRLAFFSAALGFFFFFLKWYLLIYIGILIRFFWCPAGGLRCAWLFFTLRLAFFLSFHHSVKFGPIQKLKTYLESARKVAIRKVVSVLA